MADKLVRGKNDLSSLYPELAAEWDHEKNEGLDPDMVLPGSGKESGGNALVVMNGKLPYTTGRQGMDVRYVPPEKQF